MTVIDPTTDLGKLRLRCADTSDLPFLPDVVYTQTLTDTNNNLLESARICCQYILGMLTMATRSKLAQVETFDNQQFEQYKQFILLSINNPAFMPYAPIPYGGTTNEINPLIQFQKNWNAGYSAGTADQDAYWYSTLSPLQIGLQITP